MDFIEDNNIVEMCESQKFFWFNTRFGSVPFEYIGAFILPDKSHLLIFNVDRSQISEIKAMKIQRALGSLSLQVSTDQFYLFDLPN